MNKWKIAFFLLVIAILGSIGMLFYWISSPTDQLEEEIGTKTPAGNILTLNSTKDDFEGIANTFMRKSNGR